MHVREGGGGGRGRSHAAMQQSQGGGGGANVYNAARGNSTNGSTSTSTSTSNISSRRRPHVWHDDMAEVKETFRRVARARHARGAYSAPNHTSPPRVTAPTLSRNRRARVRCQVPSKALQVPVKMLQEIQSNRSQSPFVSLNHLQNVLGMCRRIRSQHSLTERRKNPHDASVYPVYVRRPWSVSAGLYNKAVHHVSPTPQHVSPTSSQHRPHISPTSQYLSTPNAVPRSEAISLPHDVSPAGAVFNSPHVSPNRKLHSATTHVSPNSHGAAATSNFLHVSPNRYSAAATSSLHVSSSDSATPLYYKPARFKPLYDISNGVFPHAQIRKRASAANSTNPEKVRTCAKQKPYWTHYRQLISDHDDSLELQDDISPNPNACHHANPDFGMHNHSIPIHAGSLNYDMIDAMESNNVAAGAAHHNFAWNPADNDNFIITKKPRTLRPSPMGFSESWPSSSTCFSNGHYHHLSDSQAHLRFIHGLDYNDLNSDRRPHSENDLNLHSASYFQERPPSRCMKRPLSSSSCWRNVSDLLGMPTSINSNVDQSPLEFGFAVDAWSANSSTSQQECSIFIPRDLNGNILKSHPKSSTSLRLKQRYCPKSNAGYKSTSFAGALMDLSRRHRSVAGQQRVIHKHADNPNPNLGSREGGSAAKRKGLIHSGGMKKKKPMNFSSSSCLDELEGLPPSKWAKRLASDLMGTNSPCRAKNKTGDLYGKEMNMKAPVSFTAFNNGLKPRVKFASPSVQNPDEGCSFRKEAQSLASAEMIPDLLSWERDSGLLTGDPPAASHVHGEDDDDIEPDQHLLEQVEAMLGASSCSSSSPSPSPSRPTSPMQCSPVRQCVDYSSKCSDGLKIQYSSEQWEVKQDSCGSFLIKENSCTQPLTSIISSQGRQQECDEVIKGEGDIALAEAVKQGDDQVEGVKQEADINVEADIAVDLQEAVKEEDWIQEQEKVPIEAEPLMNASTFININHNTALIEAMESKCTTTTVLAKVQDIVDKDAEMREMKGHAAAAQAADAAEGALERLFQDSLDLNPTLRHIYDTMSYLNAHSTTVSSDPLSLQTFS